MNNMSPRSYSIEEPRRTPRQLRGERRVAELLQATAAVIAAAGYDAATMSAIAERAGAPIGSLYQFFPNKQAITHALRTEYGRDYEERLKALESQANHLNLERLIPRLIKLSVDFVESHPAFLALLDAPTATRSPASLRATLRQRLARCFVCVYPRVSRTKSMRLASVTLQVLKGMFQLYAEAQPQERRKYVHEYEMMLTFWLAARLPANGSR